MVRQRFSTCVFMENIVSSWAKGTHCGSGFSLQYKLFLRLEKHDFDRLQDPLSQIVWNCNGDTYIMFLGMFPVSCLVSAVLVLFHALQPPPKK